MRGKPTPSGAPSAVEGLIPACAGKTRRRPTRSPTDRAHPRVCGENVNDRMHGELESGSSPRVRGKLFHRRSARRRRRLIPACAGKTFWVWCWSRFLGAHPRVCGENTVFTDMEQLSKGSSPRVRGKLPRCFCQVVANGLIPACAGKTTLISSHSLSYRAHPRVCGENLAWFLLM